MTNTSYTTSASPQITISCQSDLLITGTAENVVTLLIEDDSSDSSFLAFFLFCFFVISIAG